MSKNRISPISVVCEGLKIYLTNLDVFFKYLTWPILGIFFGKFLLFAINYFYIIHLDKLTAINPILGNEAVILTLLLIITIPAFIILMKALFDYLVAFGAVNSMCILGAKRIKALKEHTDIVKMRLLPYSVLLIVLSILYALIPILPFIFLALTVPIFVLEEDASPYTAIKKSIVTVKNNFWLVLFSLIFMGIVSYGCIPYLISWFIGKTAIFDYLVLPIERYLSLLPIADFNNILLQNNIKYTFDIVLLAENIAYGIIGTIVIMYMIPFRSACCVYLYKNLLNDTSKEDVFESAKKYTKKAGKKGKKEE